jgi:hypothetical protein
MADNSTPFVYSTGSELPGIVGGHRALIASGILIIAGVAVVLTVLWARPRFVNPDVPVVAALASNNGTALPEELPSTAGGQALPPSQNEEAKSDDNDVVFKTAGDTESAEPSAQSLFNQFRSWATEFKAEQPKENSQREELQNPREEIIPAQKNRRISSGQITPARKPAVGPKPEPGPQSQVRFVRETRQVRPKHVAKVERGIIAHGKFRRLQNALAQSPPPQHTQADWTEQMPVVPMNLR